MEMDLHIEVIKNQDYAMLLVAGEVDAYTSGYFRETMLGVIENGLNTLIIDMCNVEYIDSSGLGALVGGLRRISENNGSIYIISCSDQVRKVFEITGLERVFKIFNNSEDAIKAIAEGEAV